MFNISIPKITNEELERRYSKLKPLVRNENNELCWIGALTPKQLRGISYIWDPKFIRPVKENELMPIQAYEFTTIHEYGYYGMFKPSVAEVLSQLTLPDYKDIFRDDYEIHDMRTDIMMKPVAFEVFDYPETREDLYKDHLHASILNAGYHVAQVRIYFSYTEFDGYPEGV